jgi:ribosomal protein S16
VQSKKKKVIVEDEDSENSIVHKSSKKVKDDDFIILSEEDEELFDSDDGGNSNADYSQSESGNKRKRLKKSKGNSNSVKKTLKKSKEFQTPKTDKKQVSSQGFTTTSSSLTKFSEKISTFSAEKTPSIIKKASKEKIDETVESPIDTTNKLILPEGVVGIGSHEHNSFDFLIPKNRRDKNGKYVEDVGYNPRTLFLTESFIKSQTPAMAQWWSFKAENMDTVLFFKVFFLFFFYLNFFLYIAFYIDIPQNQTYFMIYMYFPKVIQ